MRRRHPLRPRPALAQRAIVAFPQPALTTVEAFRATHDPLVLRIAAHVTLVFPFASSLGDLQITAHLRRVVRRWPPLPITLSGVGAYNAQWLHLRVTRGDSAITELHDRLYRGALASFLRREFTYEPHVTIARVADPATCDTIIDVARRTFRAPIMAVLHDVTLIALGADGDIEHRATVPLGAG